MKLYYWDSLTSIASYSDGIAFAIAESKEDAIEAIMKDPPSYWPTVLKLREELEKTEPDVFESAVGFWKYGSD